jgi:xanthine/uracil permease
MLSFMPAKALKKVFPPIVTGTTIFLVRFMVQHHREVRSNFAAASSGTAAAVVSMQYWRHNHNIGKLLCRALLCRSASE